jgi:rhamnogalacturonyl hydrolase YesR
MKEDMASILYAQNTHVEKLLEDFIKQFILHHASKNDKENNQ